MLINEVRSNYSNNVPGVENMECSHKERAEGGTSQVKRPVC